MARFTTSLHMRITLFSFAACLHTALAAQSLESSSHRELVREIRKLEGAQSMVNMPSVAPLFLEDAQFSSTLYIVNEGNPPVRGKLLLLSPEGRILVDKTVTVSGHDKAELPIKPLLESVNSNESRGSIELFDDNVYGSALAGEVVITFHGESTSVNIDEELLMPTMSHSHELRGIAIEAVASPVIAVSSTSEQPVQVAVNCTQSHSKAMQTSFQIRSHEIVTLRPCSDSPGPMDAAKAFHFAAGDLGSAEAKGIQIVSSEPRAEIQVFGFSPTLTDGALSFAPIAFQDPDEILSNQTVYPGVAVGYRGELWGTYQPRVVVQNYATQSRIITVYNARTRSGASAYSAAASFLVGPSSIATATIGDQGDSTDALNTYIVQSDGQPGDVQTQLWSEDPTRHSRVIFAGKDGKDDRNTGMHPWTLQDGYADDLYLYNVRGTDQQVNLKINNGHHLWKKTLLLKAYETRRVSLAELADQGLDDDAHKPFQPGANQGEISWYTTTGTVRGRLEHKDERKHLVTSFQCAGYTVFCGIPPISGPSSIALGQSAQYSDYDAMACVNNQAASLCYGVASGSFSNPSYQWSAPGSALTFQGTTDYPNVTAQATSLGSAFLEVAASSGSCYFTQSETVTVVDATPQITSISPSVWNAGTTTQNVTFSGQHFGTNAPTLKFSPSAGITYVLHAGYSDNQIVADIAVSPSTPTENVGVSVTNNGYGGSYFNGSGAGQSPTSGTQTVTVQAQPPQVQITGPNFVPMAKSGTPGAVNSIQLTASGTPTGGTYSWSTSSSVVSLINPTSATVTVQSQSVGNANVSVKYTVNNTPVTNAQPVGVLLPNSLSGTSTTVSILCPQKYNTLELVTEYSLRGQNSSGTSSVIPVQGIPVVESFAPISNNCSGVANVPSPSSWTTTSIGLLNAADGQAMCSPSCLPANSSGQPQGSCTYQFTQNFTANGYPVQTKTITMTCPGPPTQK